MKKQFTALAAAIMMIASFSACGDSKSSSSSTAETAETATEQQTTAVTQAETTTLTTEPITEAATAPSDSIEILTADSGNTPLSSSSATVTIGNKEIDLNGAYVIDGVDAVIKGGSYKSDRSDQNVFLVINGGSLTISNAEIIKTGDAVENDSERSHDVSDDYNFYGINSVVLAVGENSTVKMKDCVITSDCSGANALFSTADANFTADNVRITTTGNSSRGVYATYNGSITADNMDITTSGAHCAPIATDRGGGVVNVTNSTVNCSGDGSPCIYSTGDITVRNVKGVSTGAQAAVIEGKNSITMTDCDFTVKGGNNGLMLYQSMSGDAADKDATANVSTLTMNNSSIRNETDGAMFYITNTNSVININGTNALDCANGQLVSAGEGRWGKEGSNGGNLTLNLSGVTIDTSVTADDISSVTVNLSDNAAFNGETTGDVTIANS